MRCCCSRIIRANEPISDLSASYREGIERRHAQHDEANLPTTATMKALNQENEAISKGEKTNDDEVSPLIDVMNAALPQNYQQEKSRAVDECIAEDFLKMSIADRNSVADEIAGKSCMAREETPEMLAASLARLDVELNAIPLKKKIGYLQSQKFSKTYINDCNFRLRFLRAELFEAREAAVRLAKYCDFVLELFGSVALQRKIWLSDFDRKEIKWIQMGYIQMLPFRDSFGRRVILQIIDASVLREKRVRVSNNVN
ncbi:unnamed protein product [Pseudo-nitzschia multistriata]|uniref:Uncharacterized protein n=1 Tax=Pseudo-nitzschia multistriata TaxID=183589 RepID=A0A448YXX4_9STRA|nr:unnamed protein product [Pseudo-nitzschia multistriata]